MFRSVLNNIKRKKFLKTKAESFSSSDFDAQNFKPEFLIITIAFSNVNVIRHQIKLMDTKLKDKFTHFIVDNSDVAEQSSKIMELCRQHKRPYIRLTGNLFGRGSDSHSLALNWAFRQLVLRFKPKYFGFLDHDIYPVKEETIIPLLDKQQIYGHLQHRDDYWYLWPGLCFFKFNELFDANVDFGAGNVNGVNVDTGGALYKTIYSKLNRDKIAFPSQRYEDLREGDLIQSDKVEYIGNWMHSFNGSYWITIKDKEQQLENLINQYQQ